MHLDASDDVLRLGVPVEARSYELHGLPAPGDDAFTWRAIRDAADTANPVAYDGQLSNGIDKRLLSCSRSRYLADDLSAPLAHGEVQSKALAYDSDAMAMTESQRQSVFGGLTGAPTNAELEDEGKYVLGDDAWWVRTGHPSYDASKFYAVTSVEDPYGNVYSTTYDAHALLTVSSTDPLGNTASAEYDYRVLGPWQLTDANGNRSQVAFDVLGFVTATAVKGKVGDTDGDTLEDPTSTFEYDLFAWQNTGKPNWAKTRVREIHQDINTRWLEQRTYFSGGGGVVMVKAQARPGLAPQRDVDGELVLVDGELQYEDTSPNVRWVGNGRVVLDNKGNVLKAYEPYFSSTPDYEDEAELVEQGVTSLNHYDPLGRLVRTDPPNGTFSRVEFTPWEQTSWDVNDTVLASDWFVQRDGYEGPDVALQKEARAAQLAAKHANTPSKVHLDTLGRPFLSVAHNKDLVGNDEFFETRSVLDIQGNVLEVVDARGNSAETRTYGMLGQSLFVGSVDAGDRRHLLTALGQPMHSWDARDQRFSFSYDTLRRPIDRTVSVGGGAEKLLGRVVYGDLLASPEATNHRGRVYRVYDGAGVATSLAYDFKGQPTSERRQLVASKTTQPDWSALIGQSTIPAMATAAAPQLDTETFSASSERDALGRVLKAISPDNSEALYTYDQAGALQKVEFKRRGSATVETVVGDISYNARGQRETVIYGPANSPTTTTSYTYDPKTYRLSRLSTFRGSDNASLQGLHYHYDPAGNITDIRDTAQQTVYFQNAVVEAANSYDYDATYRLIEATGREHATQGTTQRTHEQLPVGPQPMASDPSAMRRYTQRYTYDGVGNILKMQHIPAAGTGWTRRYEYAHDGNRLLATSAPGDAANGPYTHIYSYDAHGSMTTMPHLAAMTWNHDDELQHATAGTEQVYFQYAGGIRSRKYTEKQGQATEERIYLGPFEIYRKRVNGTLEVEVELERESLHISDKSGRICVVETKTVDGGETVANQTSISRYQLSNQLGSAATEVDGSGAVISYEEYHPYGTSAYRAVDASIHVSAKRYRYTGMERDEETGLEYHSARYLVPWLGRWTATDPTHLGDGVNIYRYGHCSPASMTDTSGASGMSVSRPRASADDVAPLLDPDTAVWPEQNADGTVSLHTPNGVVITTSDHVEELQGTAHDFTGQQHKEKYADFVIDTATTLVAIESVQENRRQQKRQQVRTRVEGAVQAVGGVAEIAGGALAAPETLGFGVAAMALGFDDLQAGLRKLGTGKTAATGIYTVAEGAAILVGAQADTAASVGAWTDAGLHLGVGWGVGRAVVMAEAEATLSSATRGAGRAGAGDGYAEAVVPGGTGRAFAGHGEFRVWSGDVVIPEGTTLTLPTRHGRGIYDRTGSLIEQGRWDLISQNPRLMADIEGAASYLPGAKIPNYTLKAPNTLRIHAKSTTVEDATPLSDLLQPNAGHLEWAACLLIR
ncbi:RHS repeat domain-containing protein [Enhygromyxa salina]|uniref:tRNA(Glu)-specific nuclease WapA n=1 Tax=Enhygromyxa salina TaxID=215803 RepID=A0A2S9YWI4_9BACT|nr:RHS repeat-associated core domain-containing protein [Enhygromyxa salina]PRQ09409.1 tRNA(Glu)-specific nuclease WapA precursor [Enhygromyxa salina]